MTAHHQGLCLHGSLITEWLPRLLRSSVKNLCSATTFTFHWAKQAMKIKGSLYHPKGGEAHYKWPSVIHDPSLPVNASQAGILKVSDRSQNSLGIIVWESKKCKIYQKEFKIKSWTKRFLNTHSEVSNNFDFNVTQKEQFKERGMATNFICILFRCLRRKSHY